MKKNLKIRTGAVRGRVRFGALLLMAFAAALGNVFAAAAESPEFARTEEEWARLRDNVLEYEEIEDLIAEYNVTVQNNNEDWKKADSGKTAQDYVNQARDAVDDMYDAAANAATDIEMITGNYNARVQENAIQNTIDAAEDSLTKKWEYTKIEKSLAAEAQKAMNTYYQLQYQITAAQKNRELAQALLAQTERQQGIGTATVSDTLTARQNVQNADAQILGLQNQQESTRRRLIVMLGWDQDAVPEIRSMPAPDLSRIGTMDPAADLETAYANDYTLMADQRRLENSVTESGKQTNGANVENDRQQIAVALNTAYQSVLQAKASYDQSVMELEVSRRSCNSARAKQQAGTGTAIETLQAETSLTGAECTVKIQELALFQAMEDYDWVTKGVR